MLGWMAFFPVVTSSLISHGVKVVTLVSFHYDGHDLHDILISGNELVFRRLHTSGHFSLLTECFIRFYEFQSSCFPDHK